MAEKKDKLMKEFLEKPLEVGDSVYVPIQIFRSYEIKERNVEVEIVCINGDKYEVKLIETGMAYSTPEIQTIVKEQIKKRDIYTIGMNPFPQKNWCGKLATTQFQLESILYRCGWEKRDRKYQTKIGEVDVDELNFNPYVINKDGNKSYYQRALVWTLKDKQLLIESIYNGINCGKLVLRERGYEYVINELNKGNKEVAFRDVVDGKQRICTLLDFVNDKFTDLYGNYFSDFSKKAKNNFLNSDVFSYAVLGEEATDEDVLETFLMVNFTGKVMSQEHIDYVKEISKNI